MAKSAEKVETNEQGEQLFKIRLPLLKERRDAEFVRVNERTWLIPRGVTVEVPACVIEVLENSESLQLEGMQYQAAHEKGG